MPHVDAEPAGDCQNKTKIDSPPYRSSDTKVEAQEVEPLGGRGDRGPGGHGGE